MLLNHRQVTAIAPAKIILSGEHAVVYGNPAVAMAINRFATTTITLRQARHILFKLLDISYTARATWRTLGKLKKRIHYQYQEFLTGNCDIHDVLRQPFELLLYTFVDFLEQLHLDLPSGLVVQTSSNIPVGCGMGSSAASILSVLSALAHYFGIELDHSKYFKLGLANENLQHGRSSGLDVYLSLHGGCVHFEKEQMHHKKLPLVPMALVNTGKPTSSTGACVDYVAARLQQDKMLDDFAKVTKAFALALETNDIVAVKDCVRENHRLLCQLGVVTPKAQDFITQIEARGMSAKISGAGSIAGDNCGAVLVVGEEKIDDLVKKYDYAALEVAGEQNGIQIV